MAYNDAAAPFAWAKRAAGKMFSRSARRVRNNLGIIDKSDQIDPNVFRDPNLEWLDSYFENRQYDHLQPWEEAANETEDYVQIRQRRPRIIYPFAKNLSDRVVAKIVGESVFPKFTIEDSPDDQLFLQAVIDESNLRYHLSTPLKRAVATGSCFVRFYIIDGKYKIQWYKAKYSYPVFRENGELESLSIKYVFVDKNDTDDKGEPRKKWFRLDLGSEADITFNTPDYDRDREPEFVEVSRTEHGFGFVQGEWFRNSEDSMDGCGFIEDVYDFIDEFNYSLSQSSQAIGYNQDPQLTLTEMDETEVDTLIRSATKHWNLGRKGKAEFLEAGLGGVEHALEMRTRVGQHISDITRITILDPEKIVGNAQSAKAMEVLYGPLKDVIDELRMVLGPQIKNLLLKMAIATMEANAQGIVGPIVLPKGYVLTSLDVKTKWPALFQQTLEDLAKKVGVAGTAKLQGLIQSATATRFVAEDFGVEDVEAEVKAVQAEQAAAAALNPFGGF